MSTVKEMQREKDEIPIEVTKKCDKWEIKCSDSEARTVKLEQRKKLQAENEKKNKKCTKKRILKEYQRVRQHETFNGKQEEVRESLVTKIKERRNKENNGRQSRRNKTKKWKG